MLLHFITREDNALEDTIEIDGQHWRLTAHDVRLVQETFEPFICISYAWGTSKEPSPIHNGFAISTRTIPTLSTVARQRPLCKYFWVDAFCVPLQSPERRETLESMGFIYSAAAEVIAVLSAETRYALDCMTNQDHVCFQYLRAMEDDSWVSRAWTYQEAANAKLLSLTYEGCVDAPIGAMECLNCLGYTMGLLTDHNAYIDLVERYPRLSLLQDLLGDFCVGGYQVHSALTVMSNMELRSQERPADHFYAMIGAISMEPAKSQKIENPGELFMSLCERKGDYSFIYAMSKRDESPSKRWRPVPDDLRAILTNHSFGERQSAHTEDGVLYLDHMMVPKITTSLSDNDKFLKVVKRVIHGDDARQPSISLEQQVYRGLQTMGFKGSTKPLYLEEGLFFPVEEIPFHEMMSVIVSSEISWSFGGPGLVRYRSANADLYASGVYVGVTKGSTVSIKMT